MTLPSRSEVEQTPYALPAAKFSDVYWLIERESPAEFLGVNGNYGISPTGVFYWTSSSWDALRFNREQDARLFIGVMRNLSRRMLLEETTEGLRFGDEVPRVCDHRDMP